MTASDKSPEIVVQEKTGTQTPQIRIQADEITSPQLQSESRPPSSTGESKQHWSEGEESEERQKINRERKASPLKPSTPPAEDDRRKARAPSPKRPVGNLYLVRHAQALHNADGNLNHPDPPITLNGVYQCLELRKTFPHSKNIGQIISSPLQRTLQTTLISFAHVLGSEHYKDWTSPSQMTDCTRSDDKHKSYLGVSPADVEAGAYRVPLEIVPQLQERSNWPADTPSPPDTVKNLFPQLTPLIEECEQVVKNGGEPWWIHKGFYSTRPEHIRARGVWCRRFFYKRLEELDGKDLVVVTHGGFLKTLMENETHEWRNCGWKGFKPSAFPNEEPDGDDQDVVILEPIPGDVEGVEDLRKLAGEKGYMRLEGIEVYDTTGGEPTVEEDVSGSSALKENEKTSEDKAGVSEREKEEKSAKPSAKEVQQGSEGADEAARRLGEKTNR